MPARKKTAKAPSEQEIASYLAEHPDFLVRHGSLLDSMLAPEREMGEGISDFQRYLVERLKGQVEELRETQQALIAAGHANDMNLGRIHSAALRLVEAASLDELGSIIRDEIPALCDVDSTVLAIDRDGLPDSIVSLPVGMIDFWLGPADAMLRANTTGIPELFGTEAASIRSYAMMRLEPGNGACGVVAFGSKDPEWFTPDQATDLVGFLAGVMARQLGRLLP